VALAQRSQQLQVWDVQHDSHLASLKQRLREFVVGDVMGHGYGHAYQRMLAEDGLA
jgi:hypothetical protein